jgi:uncharacterized protein (TIGR04255 family)
MPLPKRIEPCPIKEAVVEIRFKARLPGEAVFGVIYNTLKDRYKELEKLPILQLPEAVRMNDPGLVFQPHYRLKNEGFLVQIGPETLSVVATEPYPGWPRFLDEINYVFTKARELEIVDKVTRFGMRYVDFFDLDLFENIKLHVLWDEQKVITKSMLLRLVFDKGRFRSTLQIANDATLKAKGKELKGSALDLDTYLEEEIKDFFPQVDSILDKAHQIEKELFYELLRPEFLATLNPEY